MKKYFINCLGVLAAFVFAANCGAATIWEPTDVTVTGDVNILQFPGFGLTLNGGSLALFEDTDALTPANALVLGSIGGQFSFTDNLNGTFTVDALINNVSQGTTLITGDEFILAVDWGNGYVGDSSYTQDAADPTSFLIAFDDGLNTGSSLAVDIAVVPLPAAAWLFGTALIGLVAVKRRKV